MRKNTTTVSLLIYGHNDHSELTRLIGLQPDKIVERGGSYIDGAGKVPQSIWEIGSAQSSLADVETHIKALLERLRPAKNRIAPIAKEYRTVISIGARFNEQNPEIELEPEQLAEISELGARLWLDMYFHDS
jgi:hypothetical protein